MKKTHDVLSDVLSLGMNVVFCGTAAGKRSAREGAYYAHPSNKFWKILQETGLSKEILKPSEYSRLQKYNLGLTDLCKRTSGSDKSLARGDFDIPGFWRRVEEYRPRILAFNGKTAAKKALRLKHVTYGRYGDVNGVQVWVLPSTSGLASAKWSKEPWIKLAAEVKKLR